MITRIHQICVTSLCFSFVFVNSSQSDSHEAKEKQSLPASTESKAAPSTDVSAISSAIKVIRLAIKYGAPLYNEGNHGACAAIYEVAAEALTGLGSGLSKNAMGPLRKALLEIQREEDVKERAWLLRRALDAASKALTLQKSSGAIRFDSK